MLRVGVVALFALFMAGALSPSQAQTGQVRLEFVKAGWFVGGSLGSGVLTYGGRTYPLSIGGLSAGSNGKGVRLSLQGASVGLSFDLDLSGMEITFR
jgi:hypothetical protein